MKTIAALIVVGFLAGVLYTNSLVVKVDGLQQVECATHKCFKAGSNVYMFK